MLAEQAVQRRELRLELAGLIEMYESAKRSRIREHAVVTAAKGYLNSYNARRSRFKVVK